MKCTHECLQCKTSTSALHVAVITLDDEFHSSVSLLIDFIHEICCVSACVCVCEPRRFIHIHKDQQHVFVIYLERENTHTHTQLAKTDILKAADLNENKNKNFFI